MIMMVRCNNNADNAVDEPVRVSLQRGRNVSDGRAVNTSDDDDDWALAKEEETSEDDDDDNNDVDYDVDYYFDLPLLILLPQN